MRKDLKISCQISVSIHGKTSFPMSLIITVNCQLCHMIFTGGIQTSKPFDLRFCYLGAYLAISAMFLSKCLTLCLNMV